METKAMKQQAESRPANGKQAYTPPRIEVIKMETEGVLALSNMGGDSAYSTRNRSTGYRNRSTGRSNYGSASTSDLEDLINDILTIEQ